MKMAVFFKENALRPNVFHGGGDLEENGYFLSGKRVAAECFSFARLRYDFIYTKSFFFRIGRSDLTKKLEKVGPFECDGLEIYTKSFLRKIVKNQ